MEMDGHLLAILTLTLLVEGSIRPEPDDELSGHLTDEAVLRRDKVLRQLGKLGDLLGLDGLPLGSIGGFGRLLLCVRDAVT
jgi:hypothetical protein